MHQSQTMVQRRKIIDKHRRHESHSTTARRQTRQQRRRDEYAAAARNASPTSSTRSQRRRYVKSKPPKPMPGGRVIQSGEGTLTEVSNAAYVAYGFTAMAATPGNFNLVVPVRDELQDVSDVEEPQLDDADNEVDFGNGSVTMETQSQGDLCDLLRVEELPLEVPTTQGQHSWLNSPPDTWIPTLPPFSLPLISDIVGGDYESGGGISYGDVYGGDGSSFIATNYSGKTPVSSRLYQSTPADGNTNCPPGQSHTARCRAMNIMDRDHGKADGPDQSYFNLADELLPETKRPPTFPTTGVDLISSHLPRCGLSPGEVPYLPAPSPPPLFLSAHDRLAIPPPMHVSPAFSSYSMQPRGFRQEITQGSQIASSNLPLYHTNQHPYLPPPPSNLLI